SFITRFHSFIISRTPQLPHPYLTPPPPPIYLTPTSPLHHLPDLSITLHHLPFSPHDPSRDTSALRHSSAFIWLRRHETFVVYRDLSFSGERHEAEVPTDENAEEQTVDEDKDFSLIKSDSGW
ncbi:hypothetical protein Pmani_029071, partial [Petrolisthes manimaculis]